jgi:ElaB/YqjD/DUF883 family membrane-anchored ribosome-binding protein
MRFKLMGRSCAMIHSIGYRVRQDAMSLDACQESSRHLLPGWRQLEEGDMATAKPKDTYGYLGTETVALREQIERLNAALEKAAKAEGTDAMTAASEAAREIAARAATLVDELAAKAQAAGTAMDEGRKQLEVAIREKPLTAVSVAALAGFVLAALLRR